MARLRVLLTGFGPFPGAPENPSAWLAETLAVQTALAPDCEIEAQVLPTEWEAVAALTPCLFERLQPQVMIHFGLSRRARGFRIEHSAHNRTAPRADARGALPVRLAVLPEGPDRLDTTLPTRALAAHLRAEGVPATASPSAGSYLCNFLYYRSLDWARLQASPCLALFVHMPPRPRHGGPLSESALLHAAQGILGFVLAFAHAQTETRLRRSTGDGPFAFRLEGEAGRSSIGREGGEQESRNLVLTPLPSPQERREISGSADALKSEEAP